MDIRPGQSARPVARGAMGRTTPRQMPAQTVPTQPPKVAAPKPVKPPKPVPAPAPVVPQSYREPERSRRPSRTPRRWPGIVYRVVRGLAICAIVLGLLGWFAWNEVKNSQTAIDTTKYQAVFLTDGQAYFGKLEPFTDKAMKLKDVYYLRSGNTSDSDAAKESSNPQDSGNEQTPGVELIKLGGEVHGPQDELIIMLDQLSFYENLKSDSKVVETIKVHKQKN